MEENVGSFANDLNPVSRVLQGRTHYEVLGVEAGCTEGETRLASPSIRLAIQPH